MAVEVPTGVPCPPLMNAILGTCEMTHFTTEAKLSEAEQSSLLLLPLTSYSFSSPPLSLSLSHSHGSYIFIYHGMLAGGLEMIRQSHVSCFSFFIH